jgi:microcystin-dependent protein
MSVNLSPVGNAFQFFSNDGLPLAAGKLQTFQAGSTTPLATFTDASGLIANTNPIILGTSGRPPSTIWLSDGFFYKFVLSDANDVVIQTYDNLYGIVDAQPPAATPIPTGGILLWSGSIGSIPAGYVLCNGNNGTPDLRDRFIVGAGSTYAVNATGGSADSILPTHTHGATSTSVVTDPGHIHTLTGRSNSASSGNATEFGDGTSTGFSNTDSVQNATTGITVATTTTNANAGVSATNGNLPPYYALCYIQKT